MNIINELRFTITLTAIIPAIISLFIDSYGGVDYDPSIFYWIPLSFWLLFYLIFYLTYKKEYEYSVGIKIILNINYTALAIVVFLLSLNGSKEFVQMTENTLFVPIYTTVYSVSLMALIVMPVFSILHIITKK